MGILGIIRDEAGKILLPSVVISMIGPSLLNILMSSPFLHNYPLNARSDQLRMLPLTLGLDIQFLLSKSGYYWEYVLIFLACVYAWVVVSEMILERKRRQRVSLMTMSHRIMICITFPTLALVVMRNLYFLHEHLNHATSPLLRKLVPIIWHNVGVVAKLRLGIYLLDFFKRLQRGDLEQELLLLLVTPVITSMILPFLTFATVLLSPLNITKLELDQWLYDGGTKGFNEQLVVVLFEWHDMTAINSYFELNWPCFFGFLATILWLCSAKETTISNDSSFSSVLNKNLMKLMCLVSPYIMKTLLPKLHHFIFWDDQIDKGGYTVWCTHVYLHLFALVARVRLLQHIFSSFRPQQQQSQPAQEIEDED